MYANIPFTVVNILLGISQTNFVNEILNALLESQSDDYCKRIIDKGAKITVMSLDGMCDSTAVAEKVLQPIIEHDGDISDLDTLLSSVVFEINCHMLTTLAQAQQAFFNGHTLVFAEGAEGCVSLDTRTTVERAIVQPPTSNVTKGPREGFVESMKTNITLLRKRLKTPDLKIKYQSVGKYTNTSVAVCYIDSVADTALVEEIVQRISEITVDGIIDSSYIVKFLDSAKISFFKTAGSAEKPDIVTAKLLEGRIAIVVDGSPIVVTVPYLFLEDIQGPEDYYDNAAISSVNRILRILSAVVCILLPALYVSLQLYNYQILPAKFLITIISATKSLPFTPLTEMMVVLVLFDILREANARMPSMAGLSLSIIGAVVLGDAAVRAGLLGAPAVMIGALSGIGLYALPDNTLLLSLIRLLLAFIGGITGLLGIILSVLFLLIVTVSLQSFTAPYMAPFSPDIPHDRQDAVLRDSLKNMKRRPAVFRLKNKTRIGRENDKK